MTYPLNPSESIHTPQTSTRTPSPSLNIKALAQTFSHAIFSQLFNALNGGSLSSAGNSALLKLRDWSTTISASITENLQTINAVASAGNKVISPNFDLSFIKRIPYGTPVPTVVYSTDQAALGLQSLKFTTSSATFQGVYLAPTGTQNYFSIQPGDVLSAGVKFAPKSTNTKTAGSVSIYIRWLSDGTYVGDATGATVLNNVGMSNAWQDLTVSGKAPAGANQAQVFVAANPSTPVGSIYYIDAAYVREQTLFQRIIDDIYNATHGGTGNTTIFDNIKTIFDNLKVVQDTTNEMIAPGNEVLSPNFEVSFISRLPYGGSPTLA